MAQWQAMPVEDVRVGGFQGLNEGRSPVDRPLGEASVLSNLLLSPAPALATRPGLVQVGGAVDVNPVNGLHPYYDTIGGNAQLLASAGANLAYSTGGAWTPISGTFPNQPWTAITAAIVGVDNAVIFNGGAPQKWNGTTLAPLGGTPPQGRYVVAAHQQLFVAGHTPADLAFCDVLLPESWSPQPGSNAGSIPINGHDGDPITWLGFDRVQDKVVIWSRYALWILNGPDTPFRPNLWSIRAVGRYGTPAGRTVQNVAGVWMWLTDKGIATWAGGLPSVTQTPFRDTWQTIDWLNISRACAWADLEDRYWVAFPVIGGGISFLCFDRRYNAWFAGSGFAPRVAATFRFNGRDTPVIGDASGKVHQFNGTDGTDNGTAITWNVELGPSSLGDSAYKKRLVHTIPVLSLAANGTASMQVATSETAAYGTARTLVPGAAITQLQVPLPLAPAEAARAAVLRVKIAGTGKAAIHDIMLRVAQGGI